MKQRTCSVLHRFGFQGAGFSLVELMIVVAVIAILSAVALPSYQQYVKKAARGAAQSHMLDIANRQQQYFLDQRIFAATIYGTTGLKLTQPAETNGRYTFAVDISVPAGPPPCFTITATAVGNQTSDGDLTYDCKGAKTKAGVAGW